MKYWQPILQSGFAFDDSITAEEIEKAKNALMTRFTPLFLHPNHQNIKIYFTCERKVADAYQRCLQQSKLLHGRQPRLPELRKH